MATSTPPWSTDCLSNVETQRWSFPSGNPTDKERDGQKRIKIVKEEQEGAKIPKSAQKDKDGAGEFRVQESR